MHPCVSFQGRPNSWEEVPKDPNFSHLNCLASSALANKNRSGN